MIVTYVEPRAVRPSSKLLLPSNSRSFGLDEILKDITYNTAQAGDAVSIFSVDSLSFVNESTQVDFGNTAIDLRELQAELTGYPAIVGETEERTMEAIVHELVHKTITIESIDANMIESSISIIAIQTHVHGSIYVLVIRVTNNGVELPEFLSLNGDNMVLNIMLEVHEEDAWLEL